MKTDRRYSITLKGFRNLFELITEDSSATIIPPNGMRPGVFIVKVNDYYLHAFEGAGGMDEAIVLCDNKLGPYDLMYLEQYPYAVTNYYNEPLQEYGIWELSDVMNLLKYRELIKDRTVQPIKNEPFSYDNDTCKLKINGTDISIRMKPDEVVDFMMGIKCIKHRFHIPNKCNASYTWDTLVPSLCKENYTLLAEPRMCEIWGVFNEDVKNMLMLEIAHYGEYFEHVDVLVDLDKF